MTDRDATVLLVEDEHDLADLYAMWLAEEYDVRTAYDAETGLEAMDGDVDVVLLDRRLPGMSGDEFLAAIRDDGHDSPVAMVSAVEPDFDVFEMGFDDYLVKPVEKDDLFVAVEELLSLESVDEERRDRHAQVSKRDVLEAEKTERELGRSGEYADIVGTIEGFRTRILALSETVLGSPRVDHGNARESSVYREALEDWEARKRSLEPGEPLYQIAVDKIREYEDHLSTDTGGDGEAAALGLLEEVRAEYIADGFWLDSRVLRALNHLFYGKYSESFVIDQVALDADTELERGQLFDVSRAVRERAAEELEERS